jgi:F-type H+-transporting ATPase subunit b
MININITLLIQMFNFLLLLYLLNLVLFRPIRRIIKERHQVVEDFNTNITSMSSSAQEAMEQFEQKIRQARKEGTVRVQGMKEEGLEVEAKLIKETAQQAQEKVEAIREQVKSEIREARTQLQAQVQAFSVEVSEKILGRSIQ